ncbi:Crp/Fnr family transcriptional regulator [Pedobacter sp.]|uniref:Crp/Fnr family transcriptional regulator n=1 Tax=Pedobacter sp. TaxID=1411316 RepID=UPI003BA876D4
MQEEIMDKIIQAYCNSIKQHCPKITDEAFDFWKKELDITQLKPKEVYIEADAFQKKIGYVHSGLLRAFYRDGQCNDITVNFIAEKNYATYCTSLDQPKPSKYWFQCIEPTIIINVSYSHIHDCSDKFPEMEHYFRIVIETVHRNILSRMEGFLFDNAETRYMNFLNTYRNLYNRISLSDLSSYLGIERQSLTRIRKKLANQPFDTYVSGKARK